MAKRKIYSKETEAAWYSLKEFLNPLDCSRKATYREYDDKTHKMIQRKGVYPLNKNYVLSSVYAGMDLYRASYMSKKKFTEHLSQFETYYYRSQFKSRHSIGYGSSDKQAQNQIFSEILNINSKKKVYGSYYVMLLGLDVDAHNGEKDSLEVENWLKSTYFDLSYWEPSSNFSGRHGYSKIAYHESYNLSYIISVFSEIYSLLDKKRESLGYHSVIDNPCGLPSTSSFVETNPYPDEISVDNNSLNKFLNMHRSQAFKIPRFNNKYEHCNVDDIKFFYFLPFYDFTYFEELLIDLRKEFENIESKNNFGGKIIREELNPVTIVCSPQVNTKNINDLINDTNENEIDNYWKNKTKTKLSYDDQINKIRLMSDSMERTRNFYWAYSLYLKRVPSVNEAINEYMNQKLNNNSSIDSSNRNNRFKSCYEFIKQRFDLNKIGFNLEQWEDDKAIYVSIIEKRISADTSMFWSKDGKKNYRLKTEELALIYYSILKSNQMDNTNNDVIIKNSFSYKMIQKVFNETYGKGCHRAKCAKILTLLKDLNLIEKNGNYIAHLRGNCYKAKSA